MQIKISNLNDFIFCPMSIYLKNMYQVFEDKVYYGNEISNGKAAHETIDTAKYSTRKNILQGFEIGSSKLNVIGKIDIFDIDTGVLTERKRKIVVIYDGYVFQLYAQCLSLREMGYNVKKIRFHSLVDNKIYNIKLPENDNDMMIKFNALMKDISEFDVVTFNQGNTEKCKKCIYINLCGGSKIDIET